MHRVEKYQAMIENSIKDIMIRKKNSKSSMMYKVVDNVKMKMDRMRGRQLYFNDYVIDRYIDDYWYLNCPPNLNVSSINDKVERLIHEIILMQKDDIVEEQIPKKPQQVVQHK